MPLTPVMSLGWQVTSGEGVGGWVGGWGLPLHCPCPLSPHPEPEMSAATPALPLLAGAGAAPSRLPTAWPSLGRVALGLALLLTTVASAAVVFAQVTRPAVQVSATLAAPLLLRPQVPRAAPQRPASRTARAMAPGSTSRAHAPWRGNTRLRGAAEGVEGLLDNGDIDAALSALEQADSIPAALGARLLTAAATLEPVEEPADGNMVRDPIGGGMYAASELAGAAYESSAGRPADPVQERRLVRSYHLLTTKVEGGAAAGLFGGVDTSTLPLPSGWGCTVAQLEARTGLPLSAFRPNPTTARLYWVGWAALFVLELVVAPALRVAPQPLVLATFAAGLTDQALGGGASEKILWTLNPAMADRVMRHEAGHLLVAHLLGCPVQSLTLGAWDALTRAADGQGAGRRGAGTMFFDPALNAAGLKGKVTRAEIDRYSVVLMAGIAAEALCFGEAEGGRDDEKSLRVFLSQTVRSNINVPEQARWAATNALLLLRRHRDAYERVVAVLRNEGSRDIGRVMLALEGLDGGASQ